MDKLESLITFVAVAEQDGFAAAARALDLSPAVVTRRVAELETQLGVRLLSRTTRKVALTTVGRLYLDRVRPLLHALAEADRQASAAAREVAGRVRISAPADFLRQVLVPLLGPLRAEFPGLQLELLSEEGRRQPSEAADLTVLIGPAGSLDGDFVARLVASSRALLCASPDYLATHGPLTHPSDLDRHALLLPTLPELRRDFQLRPVGGTEEAHLLRVRPGALQTWSGDALVAAALAGQGVVGSLSFVVDEALRAGRLVRVLRDWEIETWQVHLAYQHHAALTAASRALLTHLVERLGGGPLDPWCKA